MIMKIRGDHKGRDEGFTLIELMVVVLIIAILIAIAIPTFLGARRRAQNRASQSNLRNALTSEKTYYVDYQQYATDAQMVAAQIETSLLFVPAGTSASPGSREVGVAIGTTSTANDTVAMNSLSGSGCRFGLADIAAGGSAGTYFQQTNAAGTTLDAPLTVANAASGTTAFPAC